MAYLKHITETNAKKVHSKPLSFGAFGELSAACLKEEETFMALDI